MSLWAPPTISLYVSVTLLTNHQQICVLTCAQPTWSLTEFFSYSADHSPTLWRHRWQEASKFLCTKTPLLGESWTTKKIANKTRKCFLRHATNVVFSIFRGWRRKKSSTRFFETAPRAVLINLWNNELTIRIDSGPSILRGFFLHCLHSISQRDTLRLKTLVNHPPFPPSPSPHFDFKFSHDYLPPPLPTPFSVWPSLSPFPARVSFVVSAQNFVPSSLPPRPPSPPSLSPLRLSFPSSLHPPHREKIVHEQIHSENAARMCII